MSDVKLTDFSSRALQHLLDEVVFAIHVAQDKYKDNTTVLDLSARFQDLCIWRTQILNAISTVQMRDKITNS